MTTEFTIPGELPTANEVIASLNTQNRSGYAKLKRNYTYLVKLKSMKLPKIDKADFKITWYCKNKRKDKDNIMFGQKFIFDGLVDAGVLKNDGWSQVGDVAHRFKVDKDNPRIKVELII